MANTKKTATKKSTCCGSKKSGSNVQSDSSVTKSSKTASRTQSKKSNTVK
ncbi:MAG: hypothetical protein K2O04_01220 [Clostridiales bacterium]|nr:hypothetical protein [Clostridiales bacterium]